MSRQREARPGNLLTRKGYEAATSLCLSAGKTCPILSLVFFFIFSFSFLFFYCTAYLTLQLSHRKQQPKREEEEKLCLHCVFALQHI